MRNLSTIPFQVASHFPRLLAQDILPEEKRQILRSHAASLIGKTYPSIPLSAFGEFHRNGNRTHYQRLVEERNADLADLLFAAFFDQTDACIPSLLDLVYLITSEIAWWLPAHNLYQRDARIIAYPDTTRPIICLHAAETAALLALTVTLLDDRLPGEAIRHVKAEIERRILIPYETMHFWWMGDGGEQVNNWGPWCTQNVLLCYALLVADPIRKQQAIQHACRTLDRFLEGYGDDGACEEGPEYYHHAAVTLFGSLWVLQGMTGNAFSCVFEEAKIRNMAAFVKQMHISEDWYFNFSDCSARIAPSGLKEYGFAKAVHDTDLMRFFRTRWMCRSIPEKLLLSSRYAFDRLCTYALWKEVTEAPDVPIADQRKTGAVHFPSTGLHLFRTKGFDVALNAGNNGVSHNHNDTGSIILFKEGKPVLIDVGVETYTAKTFSPERYTIWTMQDWFHNLTIFPSFQQQVGASFRATDVMVSDHGVSCELAKAYPPSMPLESYRREVSFGNGCVVIRDVVRTSVSHELVLMSAFFPQRTATGLMIGPACLEFQGIPKTESILLEDEKLRNVWGEHIYRTTIPYGQEIMVSIT